MDEGAFIRRKMTVFDDDVITVTVAVASSLSAVILSAVILSAFLAQTLSERKEMKRSRSLAASCLAIHFVQSPPIEKYFDLLTGPTEGVAWTEESLPLLFEESRRMKPYDIPFNKVHGNLLNLDRVLADVIIKLEIFVGYINEWLLDNTEGYSSFSSQSQMTKSQILKGIETNKKINRAISEFIGLLATESRAARWRLFAKKKKRFSFGERKRIIFDWSPIDKKYYEVNDLFLEPMKSSIHP
jgi:hypothetical protein